MIDLRALVELSRAKKKAFFVLHDVFLVVLTFWLSISLRVGIVGEWHNAKNWLLLSVLTGCSVAGFRFLGLYRTVIRYAGLRLIRQVLWGSALSVMILLVTAYFVYTGFPRSVPFVYFMLLSIFLVGSRFTVKSLLQDEQKNRNRPIVIYGAGSAGRLVFATTMKIGDFLPVAFVDDDTLLHHKQVRNLTVYPADQLPYLAEHFGLEAVILAMPNASQQQRKSIMKRLSKVSCEILSVPNLQALNLLGKAAGIRVLQKVSIVDLLGRDAVVPIPELMNKNITGKTVMVTGAGGSIGSELCRQIVLQQPDKLILFELSEVALYEINQELLKLIADRCLEVQLTPVLGSVEHRRRMFELMKAHAVETVYHSAAYKHVPLVEHNTIEGIRNNVFGTLHCALAAMEAGVDTFVLISTDKAVRPTSIMGASKRMSELVLQALAERENCHTHFCMVRFGNVLGSSGSVIPLFEKQLSGGGPITLTHPEMTRFFMTITEAAQLVIQAGAMGRGGDVFLLDMGDPIKIIDLARQMIRLSGLTVRDEQNPNGDIEIEITGLRPGEKLYEELLIGKSPEGTRHPRIMTGKESMLPWHELETILVSMEQACKAFNPQEVRSLLLKAPTGFKPSDEVCDILRSKKQCD